MKSPSTFAPLALNARNDSGFTLLELMVVVAIIGVLSAVAVPMYSRFAARARQVEAKSALAAVFVAEKSFVLEYDTYTACLGQVGYAPTGWVAGGGGGNRYYVVGFGVAPANNCGPSAGGVSCLGYVYTGSGVPPLNTCAYSEGSAFFLASVAANGSTGAATAAQLPAATVATMAFTIGAAGYVSSQNNLPDIWTIDDNRSLQNTDSEI